MMGLTVLPATPAVTYLYLIVLLADDKAARYAVPQAVDQPPVPARRSPAGHINGGSTVIDGGRHAVSTAAAGRPCPPVPPGAVGTTASLSRLSGFTVAPDRWPPPAHRLS
jgi:hypothetical protein